MWHLAIYALVYGVMPAVMVSPLVCAADKYGIGIRIQSLHWTVDSSQKCHLFSPPLSTLPKFWLTIEVAAPESVHVGGGSSKRSILIIYVYIRLRQDLVNTICIVWCSISLLCLLGVCTQQLAIMLL